MAAIHPDLARRLDADPESVHEVIVLARDSLEDLLAAVPSGLEVRHVYRLRKGIAAAGTASSIRALAASGAAASVEPDYPVSAAGEPGAGEDR